MREGRCEGGFVNRVDKFVLEARGVGCRGTWRGSTRYTFLKKYIDTHSSMCYSDANDGRYDARRAGTREVTVCPHEMR